MKKLITILCVFASFTGFAQTKISALPTATGKGQGTVIPVVQGGVTKQLPTENILSYADSLKTVIDAAIATKQATLVSGTNIKTINGNSVLGSGDLSVSGIGGTTSYQIQTASGSTEFTFTDVPASLNDYIIFVNGVAIRPTTDYTTSGNVVTISTIVTGDRVRFQRVK